MCGKIYPKNMSIKLSCFTTVGVVTLFIGMKLLNNSLGAIAYMLMAGNESIFYP